MHRSFRFSLFVILLLLLGIRSFAQQTQNFASHSVLAKGQWSRWAVSQTGIQKLSAADLSAAGWSLMRNHRTSTFYIAETVLNSVEDKQWLSLG